MQGARDLVGRHLHGVQCGADLRLRARIDVGKVLHPHIGLRLSDRVGEH